MNDWTSDGQGKSQKLCSFDKSTAEHHTLSKQTSAAGDKCPRPVPRRPVNGFLIIYIISISPVLFPLVHPLPAADIAAGPNGDSTASSLLGI